MLFETVKLLYSPFTRMFFTTTFQQQYDTQRGFRKDASKCVQGSMVRLPASTILSKYFHCLIIMCIENIQFHQEFNKFSLKNSLYSLEFFSSTEFLRKLKRTSILKIFCLYSVDAVFISIHGGLTHSVHLVHC